eukprot:2542693-Prymnesium_polylepis.1
MAPHGTAWHRMAPHVHVAAPAQLRPVRTTERNSRGWQPQQGVAASTGGGSLNRGWQPAARPPSAL